MQEYGRVLSEIIKRNRKLSSKIENYPIQANTSQFELRVVRSSKLRQDSLLEQIAFYDKAYIVTIIKTFHEGMFGHVIHTYLDRYLSSKLFGNFTIPSQILQHLKWLLSTSSSMSLYLCNLKIRAFYISPAVTNLYQSCFAIRSVKKSPNQETGLENRDGAGWLEQGRSVICSERPLQYQGSE